MMKIDKIKKALRFLLHPINNFIISQKRTPTFWLNKYLKNTNLTILQIGSNDGRSGDPIFQLKVKNNLWKVVFIEPIPYLSDKLKETYILE